MREQATVGFTNKIWKFSIAATLAILFVIVSSKPAHALWNIFPDTGNYGMNDAVAVVARDGGGYTLTSEQAFFKIFSPRSSLTITVEYICNSYNWGNSEAQIQWWANSANEQAIDANPSTPFVDPLGAFDTASCGAGDNFTTPTISGSSLSSVLSHEPFYTYTLAVIHTGAAGGINGFRVTTYTPGDYVTFREQTLAEATTAGAYPGYRAFAVLDQVFGGNPRGEDTYTFVFGTDCTITTDVQAFLRWSDADFGISNEQGDPPISFTLFDVTDGTSITRSGPQLMNTIGLNNDDKEFEFTAKPNHKYQWVWNNVDNINGVQVWMPFSEINYVQPCPNTPPPPPPPSSCAGQPYTFTGGPPGWAGCTASIAGASYGANQTCSALVASQVNGIVSASCGGSTLTSTSSTASASGTVVYSIQTCPTYNYLTGACPGGYVSSGSQSASASLLPCAWAYAHNSSLTNEGPTTPKPNDLIQVNATIYNDFGNIYDGYGPNHQVCIEPYSGTEFLVNNGVPTGPNAGGCFVAGIAVVCRGGPLQSGGSASYFGNWQVRPDAPQDAEICFSIESTPQEGPSWPAVAIGSGGINATPLGARCFSVYNLRFDLKVPEVVTDPAEVAFAGQTVGVTVTICNEEDESGIIGPPYPPEPALRGIAPNVIVSSDPSGGLDPGINGVYTIPPGVPTVPVTGNLCSPTPLTGSAIVPITAPVGSQVCAIITTNYNRGFSDPADIRPEGGPLIGQDCVTVIDAPYVKVYGNDIWSGGNFNFDGNCNVDTTPLSGVTGDIKGRSINTFGSATNYVGAVEQYAAFALGDITAFGTAEVSATGSGYNLLAFANTGPALGNFGASQCLSNIFDTGGAGGQIDDLLWNSSTTSPDINTAINSATPGQHSFNGPQTISTSNPITDSKTILVDGSVEINVPSGNLINTTAYGTVGAPNIPVLVVIATGDITINANMRRLDGIFISLGTIHTCPMQLFLSIDPPCNQSLEVHGSFIANEIAFRRTAGGINGASTRASVHTSRCNYPPSAGLTIPGSNVSSAPPMDFDIPCSAEVFRFNPELYLGDAIFRRGANQPFNIQQIRELPPIF